MRSTLSDIERTSLADIIFNVDLAAVFVDGMTFDGFLADLKTFYAVVRCLEIVSEASRRLSPELQARHAGIPWRQIAAAGNVYRHDYEDVAQREVWRTVHEGLPELRTAIEAELANLAVP